MTYEFLQKKGFIFALSLLLLLGIGISELSAQKKPVIPRLSLTGSGGGYDTQWYPDGRIWIPYSTEFQQREFLVPVFIDNRWATRDETKDIYKAMPIRSFQFTVLYDSSAVRVVDVIKQSPRDESLGYDPLAKHFNLTFHDRPDYDYWFYLKDNPTRQDFQRGRGVTIVGTSATPLPNTDLDNEEFKVLLYIKFRVVADATNLGINLNTPIYIKNDTIRYNDLNIAFNNGKGQRPFDEVPGTTYEYPRYNTGLAGLNNEDLASEPVYANEPTKEGTIYLRIMTELPAIEFRMERGKGLVPGLVRLQPNLYNLLDPLTVDAGSRNPQYGTRIIQVLNATNLSRLQDVKIESDQPWLLFRTVAPGQGGFASPTRKALFKWIDNGILGTQQDPRMNIPPDDGNVFLELRADPTKLIPNDENPEPFGMYNGYITISSESAQISPVRLRVSFIYFRAPWEAEFIEETSGAYTRGMTLTLRNSNTTPESLNMIFGTGIKATKNADTLFGEFAYDYEMSTTKFDARFIPQEEYIPGQFNPIEDRFGGLGLGDFAANDETPRSVSRDIRSFDDTTESIIYYVKFSNPDPNDYPVVIEWNLDEFVPGASAFLHDTENGRIFPSVNMRNATPIGNNRMAFTIQDPRITSFIIEYTLPRVVEFLEESGEPKIKRGWNLLSLPVLPTNREYLNIYPNAINVPYYFTQNQYQEDLILDPGVGYFIKYGNVIDTQFVGSVIRELSVELGNAPRVRPGDAGNGGWNSVGGLSFPVSIQNIRFDEFPGAQLPSRQYTLTNGVWEYVTDRGYREVSVIEPGKGYWIKVNSDGYYHLEGPGLKVNAPARGVEKTDVLARSSKVEVIDNAQRSAELYLTSATNFNEEMFQMPPAPNYADFFDVRFSNEAYVENASSPVISLQGVEYPVVLSVAKADANYTFVDAATGEVFGTVYQGSTETVTVKEAKANAIRVLRETATGLEFGVSNYPNPVATTSNIKFVVNESNNVTLKVYDAFGNEVATLVNGFVNAGEHFAAFDASALAAGSYYAKLISGDNTSVVNITVVK